MNTKANQFFISPLSKNSLTVQRDKILAFLSLIHPFLQSKNRQDYCLEILPIARSSNCSFVKPVNLWRDDSKSIAYLDKFLSGINGNPFCAYYSGFALDYDMIGTRPDGSRFRRGQINAQNAVFTQILPMDFDHIDTADHDKYLDAFQRLGLEFVSVFTGHGYQDIILLERAVNNADVYKLFTRLLLSKGFPVDPKIIDSSRVLRLPFTYNCKEFDKTSEYFSDFPSPVRTNILYETSKRYRIREVFKKFYDLPTILPEYEDFKNIDALFSLLSEVSGDGSDLLSAAPVVVSGGISSRSDAYRGIRTDFSMLDLDLLPEPVLNMLTSTPAGLRNSVLFFLVPFLKKKIGLSLVTIKKIASAWADRCDPPLDHEFAESEAERIFQYNQSGVGAYTQELADEFGFLQLDSYKLDNKILIPNDFIKQYANLSDGAVKTYLLMKLSEKINGVREWSYQDICKAALVERRVLDKYLPELVSFGFLDKIRSYRKSGIPYAYYISKYYNRSLGFTFLGSATLENMVLNRNRTLIDPEIKLYTFLCMMISNSKNDECFASQSYLAVSIGKSRPTVLRITDSLARKKYLSKQTYHDDLDIPHCRYSLLY